MRIVLLIFNICSARMISNEGQYCSFTLISILVLIAKILFFNFEFQIIIFITINFIGRKGRSLDKNSTDGVHATLAELSKLAFFKCGLIFNLNISLTILDGNLYQESH